MTNRTVYDTVRRDVELAVYMAVLGDTIRCVWRDVDQGVDVAAPRAMRRAIMNRRGPPHPGLEFYLVGGGSMVTETVFLNRAVNLAVSRAAYASVYHGVLRAVGGDVYDAMHRDVFQVVNRAVYTPVGRALDRAVFGDGFQAMMEGPTTASDPKPIPLGLELYLTVVVG